MVKIRNETLNILEAVSAMLVVFIHISFPGTLGNMVIAVARISVPFFFGVSGYFFYKGDREKELKSIPRKIKRLLWLMLESETLYFLFYLALQVDNHGFSFQALKNVFVLEIGKSFCAELRDRLVVFSPPLNATFWFVGSLIAVYAIIYPVVKYRRQKAAWIVSLVSLAVCFVLRRILCHEGVYTSLPYERLLPCLPIPFFLTGYFLRQNQDRLNRIEDAVYGIAFGIGVALTLAEQFTRTHTVYLGTLILVPSMLSFCGKHGMDTPKTILGRVFSHIGARSATYVYMLHMMIANILWVMVPRLLPIDPQSRTFAWIFPVLVCMVSVICAEAVCVLKQVLSRKR